MMMGRLRLTPPDFASDLLPVHFGHEVVNDHNVHWAHRSQF
jgi:hypothetical protein